MQKPLKLLYVLLLLLSSCDMLHKEEKADPQLMQELTQKMELTKGIEQYSQKILANLLQARQNSQLQSYSDDEFKELVAIYSSVLNAQKLKDNISQQLSVKLSAGDIKAVLVWFNSPLDEKIRRLDQDASTPEAIAEARTMGEKLGSDPGRVALIKKLIHTTMASEATSKTLTHMNEALLTAAYVGNPLESRPSDEEIMNVAEKDAEQNRAKIEQLVLYYCLYTYRTLSNADLDQYISFYESDAGKKFATTQLAAISDAQLQANHELYTKVNKMVMERNGENSAIKSELADTKEFSLNELNTSLEKIVPRSVALKQVQCKRQDHAVALSLNGTAKSAEDLKSFIAELEKSALFKNPVLKQQSMGKGLITFRIDVVYLDKGAEKAEGKQ